MRTWRWVVAAELACLWAVGSPPGRAETPTLSVCQALTERLRFDGQFVKIRGAVVGTEEGTWLKDDACPKIVSADGFAWDPIISVDAPPATVQSHNVPYEYDVHSEARIRKKYARLRRRHSDKCLVFTFSGVLGTQPEFPLLRSGRPRGFGHLNGAPAQLIIRSQDDVAVIPGCREPAK